MQRSLKVAYALSQSKPVGSHHMTQWRSDVEAVCLVGAVLVPNFDRAAFLAAATYTPEPTNGYVGTLRQRLADARAEEAMAHGSRRNGYHMPTPEQHAAN